MPLQQLQQLAHGPIMRDRIRHRHYCLEPKQPLLITLHDSPLIWPFSSGVLHIVEAFAVRLPDVDLDALDWLAVCVFDGTEDEAGLAVGIVGDCGAVGLGEGFMGVEGAENGAFCAGGWFGVVDAIDEEGEADDVGEENEFLSDDQFLLSNLGRVVEPTCRTSVHIWPTLVKNWMPVIHSSWLSRVSRAKSCTCWTSLSRIYFSLGSGHCPLISLTLSVMLSIVKSLSSGTSTSDGSIVRREKYGNLMKQLAVFQSSVRKDMKRGMRVAYT